MMYDVSGIMPSIWGDFGQNNQGNQTPPGSCTSPNLYAIRFLKTHSAVSPNPSPFGLLSSDAASILKSKIGIGD